VSGNMLCDKHVINIANSDDVCFCRLMSQLSDINIQSSVGMFNFCNVLHYSIAAEIGI